MPFFAPPRSDTHVQHDSAHSGACSPTPRGGHPRARLLGISAVALVLLVVASGFAVFVVSNGLPPNPVLSSAGGANGAPAGSLPSHARSADGSGVVPTSLDAPSGACISGNRDSFGSSVTIGPAEAVCGNVSVYGGSATIIGQVSGNVTVVAGSADVSGQIDGNLTAIGGSITLQRGASVGGNVDAVGGSVTRAPGATIGGNLEQGLSGQGGGPPPWMGVFDGASLPWFHILFWALAGLCVAIFFPGPLRRVRDVARREPGMSFLGGLAALFFGIIVALVLFITCLGIPIALLLLLGLWLAWIVGTVALGFWIGEGLLRLGAAHDRSPVVATVLGVTLLSLFESIPCLGGVISFVAGFIGLGASTLALLHSRRMASWRSRAA